MRSKVLKQNNLMLRSEHRERLEAWATSGSLISDSQCWGPASEATVAKLPPPQHNPRDHVASHSRYIYKLRIVARTGEGFA
jgi:hypothetical protein